MSVEPVESAENLKTDDMCESCNDSFKTKEDVLNKSHGKKACIILCNQ